MPTLGERIRRARERLKWTQRDLAAAVGVNVKTVDNWENDRTSPKNRLGALEETLGTRLRDEPSPAEDSEGLTSEELELLERIRRDPRKRRRLLDAILAGYGQERDSDSSDGDNAAGRNVS